MLPELSPDHPVRRWTTAGWLRSLDQAFACFLLERAPDVPESVLVAAALASHQAGRGHICLDLRQMLEDPGGVLSLPPEQAGDIEQTPAPAAVLGRRPLSRWLELLGASPVVEGGEGSAPLVLDGHRLYLRRYWLHERAIAGRIARRLTMEVPAPTDLRERLEAVYAGPPEVRPDWQRVACALAARAAFSVITGGPGTGKTTTVVRLLALLQSAAREGMLGHPARSLRIRLAAPTGKAASRLTEAIGVALRQLLPAFAVGVPAEVSTLHRLLGVVPGSRHFRHHAHNPLHADLVVVDEASMVDVELMAALLDALPDRCRLVLLGDRDQLASVEAGAVLGDICRHADEVRYDAATLAWLRDGAGLKVEGGHGTGTRLDQQVVMLRLSHRFGADSGIGELARRVNAGASDAVAAVWAAGYPDILRLQVDSTDAPEVERVTVDGRVDDDAAPGYRQYLDVMHGRRPPAHLAQEDPAWDAWAGEVLDAFGRVRVLSALRAGPWGVEALNRCVVSALGKRQRQGRPLLEPRGNWYEGRPVLVTGNDYALGLMNGDTGVTLAFPDGSGGTRLRVVFRLPDGRLRRVLPGRLEAVETVFAMTVHKSQGSEFEHTVLVLPDRPSPVITRELVYTAITRASRRFSLVVADAQVEREAVLRRVLRSSGLAERLEALGDCNGDPLTPDPSP